MSRPPPSQQQQQHQTQIQSGSKTLLASIPHQNSKSERQHNETLQRTIAAAAAAAASLNGSNFLNQSPHHKPNNQVNIRIF